MRRILPIVLLSAVSCARQVAPAAAVDAPVHDEAAGLVVADDLAAPLPVDPRVRVGRLDNGVTWYIEPNQRPEGRAELRLAVKAGSVLETDAQRGLAHFVEHMAFNGTRHFQGNDLIAYLESIGTQFGAHLNAYTSFDETVYKLQLPTDDPKVLETGFLVLRDWADGVVFDRDECEKERGVVLEEWRLGQGLQDRISKVTLPAMFHGSRYAERLPIGTQESLQTFDCAQAKRFYETWYRPELMAVMAVGDFDPAQVEGMVEKWFGDLAADEPVERPWYTVPDHDETLVTVFTDPELPGSALAVLDKVPEVEGDTHAAYRVFLLEQMVFLMMNERLGIAAQDPDAAGVGAFASESSLGHLRAAQVLTVAPKAGRELDALQEALVELERVKRFGFTRGELDRARDELARSLQAYYDERAKTDSQTHVDELLRVFLTDEPMPGIPYEYALSRAYLPDITLAEANTFARGAWFPGRSRVLQALFPENGAPPPTNEQLLAVFDRVAAMELTPPAEDEADAPLMAALPQPGRAEKVAEDRQLGTSTWRLSNGVTVVLRPTEFQEDEVLFEAFSAGGTSVVSDADYVPAITATSLLLRSGVGEHDAVALAKLLAGRQARVSPALGRTREFLSGGASVRDVEFMFQLLHLGLTQPRFDPKAFELEKQGRTELLRNRQVSPDAVFEDAWSELVWQGDERQTNWTLDDLEQLDLAASERVYRDRFGDLTGWTFVFVGNVDEATLIPLLERYVASLPASGKEESWQDDGVARVAGVHWLELPRGQTPRGRVRLLFHGPFRPDPTSRMVLEATAAVLETRLREELREERGGTYGVSVQESTVKEPQGGYALQIDFETDPERLDELLDATWRIVDEVRTTIYADAAVDAIREKNRRSRETAMRTNGFWLGAIVGALSRGEDPRVEVMGFDIRNKRITARAIRDMAARVLDEGQFVQAVQRPAAEAEIGPAEEAGLP